MAPDRYGMVGSGDISGWLSAGGIDNGSGCESANKYGITYSENMSAVMSGISFNYSDFFP